MSLENLFSGILKNKTVLVTGHTGFQGTWLSVWLKLLGSNVIGYALEPPTQPSLFETLSLEHDMKHIIGDLRDKEKLSNVINQNKPEIVFHLGAQALVRKSYDDPLETFETNIMGTANLLESIRKCTSVKSTVIMTSDKCYENKKMSKPHVEDDPMGGFDPYSASKGATELITSSYRDSFFKNNSNLSNIATARAGNVIGGGDWADDRIVPDLIKSIIKNKNPILRNPNSKRPWQYVLEPLFGILWLAAKMYQEPTKFDEAWNFGPANNSLTVRELADAILKEWDTNLMCEIQNNSDVMPETDILLLNSSKAEKNLGWKNILSIEEAIFETVSWYKKNKNDVEEIKQFSINQIENYVNKAKQRNTILA